MFGTGTPIERLRSDAEPCTPAREDGLQLEACPIHSHFPKRSSKSPLPIPAYLRG